MLRPRITTIGVLIVVVASTASAGDLVVGEPHGETGAREVLLVASAEPGVFGDLTLGETVKGFPQPTTRPASFGGYLAWRQYGTKVSDDGLMHEYYELRYLPNDLELLPNVEPGAGFKVNGGYLAYHSTKEHGLYMVTGAMYDDVKYIRNPVITSARDALVIAVEAAGRGGLDVITLEMADADLVRALVEKGELRLHPTPDPAEFGFAWHLAVPTRNGGAKPVVVDATDGALIAVLEPMKWDPGCGPSSDLPLVSVVGTPQRASIGTIPLNGTPSTAGGWRCVDAHQPQDSVRPDIQVLRGANSSWCDQSHPNRKYIPAHGTCENGTGSPEYRTVAVPEIWGDYSCTPGGAITDALRHTITTFDVLWGVVGYQGIQGSGVPFRVVVDARCSDGAFYQPFDDDSNDAAPAGSVAFCGLSSDPAPTFDPATACQPYAGLMVFSAALDIVAHEIGHGVILTTTGLNRTSPLERELHEGFADTIGHGVEWLGHGPSPLEGPDWLGGEDKGAYDRRVDSDEGNLRFFNSDSQHDGSDHARGTPLPVAMRLLAEGGFNPACSGGFNHPSALACAASVDGVGVETAFRTYFTMLNEYVQPSTDWPSFPGMIVAAAGQLEANRVAGPPIVWNPGPIVRPCVEYSALKYAAWESMAAIELPGRVRFCSTPS